jgi:hypothetical protein
MNYNRLPPNGRQLNLAGAIIHPSSSPADRWISAWRDQVRQVLPRPAARGLALRISAGRIAGVIGAKISTGAPRSRGLALKLGRRGLALTLEISAAV